MKIRLLVFCLLLVGCVKDTTVTDDVFTGVHSDISDLTQQLPSECKTSTVNARIKSLSERVSLAQKSCNKDIGDCRAEVRRWQFRFYGLMAAIIAAAVLLIYRRLRKIF